MCRIAILGKGNVGTHLHRAMAAAGIEADLYSSRGFDGFSYNPDIILLTVKDDVIEDMSTLLASRLSCFNGVVAHTSGSVSIEVLRPFFNNIGVFYPLQTFSKANLSLKYSEIPFFIEGSDSDVTQKLESLAMLLSRNVFRLDSPQRMKMHIASVFACNFSNALFNISHGILEEAGIPFEVIIPLIHETVRKLETLSPKEAQTGPAIRGDSKVISRHLDSLSSYPDLQNIYRLLTEYINPDNIK